MKTRFSIFLIAVLSVVSLFSCSSDNDGDEIKENSIEDNLPDELKAFVGFWSNQTNKGGNFIFFADGNCWMFPFFSGGKVEGYWSYDSSSKVLATTTNNWQWQVTLSNSEAWAGVSLGTSSVQSFSKYSNTLFLKELLYDSTWEESADSTLIIENYHEYVASKKYSYSVIKLGGTVNIGNMYIDFFEDENTEDNILSYKLYTVEINEYNRQYYAVTQRGSGSVEILYPTYLSNNKLRFTGDINKTLKRKKK